MTASDGPRRGRGASLGELLGLLYFPGLTAMIMVLPAVVLGPLAFAIRDDVHFTRSDIGTTFSVFFLASAVVSGAGGPIVGRFGAPAVVRCGLFGAALAASALALSTSRWALYVTTLTAGVLNGITAVAISLTIMTHVAPRHRGLAFGIRTAGMPSAAAVAGLGAYLVAGGHLPWRQLLWVVAAVALVSALTLRRGPSGEGATRQGEVEVRDAGSVRTLRLLGLAGLLGSLGTAVVTPFLVEGLIEQGQPPGRAAAVLAVAGWFGIVSRVVVGALSDRVPDPLVHLNAAAVLIVVLGVSMVCLAVGRGTFLLVGATIMVFGLGFAWPGLLLFAALATHASHAATAAGQMQFGQHSGAVVGPMLFGVLVASHSFTVAWCAAAVVLAVAALLLALVARRLRGGGAPLVDC